VRLYFEQGAIRIYQGDAREPWPFAVDDVGLVVADPPHGDTKLAWDRWPRGWPAAVAERVPEPAGMWCCGSLRSFMRRAGEFSAWRLSQDVAWEKHNGSSFLADRFRPVHELAAFFYRGRWAAVHHAVQMTMDATRRTVRTKSRPPHMGSLERAPYVSEDGGPRLARSVIWAPSMHGEAENETQKPAGVVEVLVRYGLAPGKTLLSLFCGSGTDLVVAKQLGAPAVGVELREEQCEVAARRVVGAMALGGPLGSR